MITSLKHIIQTVNVDVNVPDVSAARSTHINIGELLTSAVFPLVERHLNLLYLNELYYRIETVTVDLVFNSVEEMENDLLQTVSAAIIKQISVQDPFAGINDFPVNKTWQIRTDAEESLEIFIYFLQTGNRPWYAANHDLHSDEIIYLLENKSAFRNKVQKILQQHPLAAERLIKQFDTAFILLLLEKISAIAPEVYRKRFETVITGINAEIDAAKKRRSFIELLNTVLLIKGNGEMNDVAAMQAIKVFEDENRNEDIGLEKESVTGNKKKSFPADDEQGLFVKNAGIILLHPFLQSFFKEFDLLQADAFKDEQSQELAVHLLHYLATGNEYSFEYDLLMEKFLCGIAQHQPVGRFMLLTEKMKNECSNLLKAAIYHWFALKNTSPEGLQEGFLRRDGKLVLSLQQNRLIVELTSIDILLEKLPWNYSIIKLPWMEQVLYVDWIVG